MSNYFIYYSELFDEFAAMRLDNSLVFHDRDYYVVVKYVEKMGLTYSLDCDFKQ